MRKEEMTGPRQLLGLLLFSIAALQSSCLSENMNAGAEAVKKSLHAETCDVQVGMITSHIEGQEQPSVRYVQLSVTGVPQVDSIGRSYLFTSLAAIRFAQWQDEGFFSTYDLIAIIVHGEDTSVTQNYTTAELRTQLQGVDTLEYFLEVLEQERDTAFVGNLIAFFSDSLKAEFVKWDAENVTTLGIPVANRFLGFEVLEDRKTGLRLTRYSIAMIYGREVVGYFDVGLTSDFKVWEFSSFDPFTKRKKAV